MQRSVITSGAVRIIGAAFAFVAALGFAEPAAEAPDTQVAVVATTNIVGDVVSQIGGERISLYVLLPIGADPHAFQATPRDARQVADSDVVFTNGAGLEEDFLGDLVASAAPRRVVDLSSGMELRRPEDEHDEHGDEDHDDEDHDDEDHEDEEHHDEHEDEEHDEEAHEDHDDEDEEHDEHEDEEDEHGEEDEHADEHGHDEEDEHRHAHDHGEFDPHVWMDPTLVADAWTPTIAAALAEADPAGAGAYAERAAALAAELHELDAWVREQVAAVPAAKRILITDHDVFGYFADRYGFTLLDSIVPGLSTASEPSARHLASLRDAISEHAVPAVFAGTTVNPQAAQVLADDLNIEMVSVYTGSLSAADGPAATYQDFIRTNVERIVTALGQE